ncbi:MAG TPA: molybdenum cofactor guanylyltransferase [Blastocatellia bacterium]|nr:molybdenum cofactor guanylyltransferase [Blastocatellia bacterium]
MNTTGFVTAGGQSSRMGSDKSWLDLGGQTLIERVIAALAPAVETIAIIANSERYRSLGYPVYSDENTGIGPLEAIRVALTNSKTEYAIVVGCDLPFVTADLFSTLLELGRGFDAVVPESSAGQLEPLCAAYSVRALPAVDEIIRGGRRKTAYVFDQVHTRIVAFDEIQSLGGSHLFFVNVNTREDYARAQQLAESRR